MNKLKTLVNDKLRKTSVEHEGIQVVLEYGSYNTLYGWYELSVHSGNGSIYSMMGVSTTCHKPLIDEAVQLLSTEPEGFKKELDNILKMSNNPNDLLMKYVKQGSRVLAYLVFVQSLKTLSHESIKDYSAFMLGIPNNEKLELDDCRDENQLGAYVKVKPGKLYFNPISPWVARLFYSNESAFKFIEFEEPQPSRDVVNAFNNNPNLLDYASLAFNNNRKGYKDLKTLINQGEPLI